MSFLRYVEGAKPGKKRPVQPQENKSSSKTAYETKRIRSFLPQWQNNRQWLTYDGEKMFCKVCTEFGTEENSSGPFVKGSNYFRLESIKQHEVSKVHCKASEKYLAKSLPVSQSKAAECLFNLKKADYDRLTLKFRNAHAIAKSHMSFRSYTTLCRLDKMKGLDVGASYLNDKAAGDFTDFIAQVTMSEVVTRLQKSTFCSFTCDGSTDFTGEDIENIYLRTCTNGKIEDSFLHIGSAESARSSDIHDFILNVFKDMGIHSLMKEKLVGFCSDGASNMQGVKSGLATLLKVDWPHLLVTHCLAHRLELAFKDAIKASAPTLYAKATTLLLGLYYFYRKSPKQKKALLRTFTMLDMRPVLPTRIGGTRWLPHYKRAIESFIKGYRALRMQLETSSQENPKAEGFVKLARDGGVLVFLLSLRTIISVLMKLSLFLQKREISLADAYTRVRATIGVIGQLQLKNDSDISSVLTEDSFLTEKVIFKGQKPSLENQKLIKSIVTAMESRFPSSTIVDSTIISSLKNLKNTAEYGNTEVKVIYDQFEGVLGKLPLSDVQAEWTMLKALVFEKYSDKLEQDSVTWEMIQRELSDQGLDNIFTIMDLIRALPPTSVRNETTFSAMKLLKTKRRGRLSTRRLNNLMMIHLQSPDIEDFDPEQAIKGWMVTPSGRKRRLQYTRANPDVNAIVQPAQQPSTSIETDIIPSSSQTSEANQIEVLSQSSYSKGDAFDESDESDYFSDEEENNEMTEDYVFSLLKSFRE